MVSRQPGEILSDPDDDKLYHVGGASGYPCDEILQANRSCDVIPDFKGVNYYSSCFGDYATIRGIDEPGLGHRLTIGLDETSRTMVICDLGDIDADFGFGVSAEPRLYVTSSGATVNDAAWLVYNGLHLDAGVVELKYTANQMQLRNYGISGMLFQQFGNDISAGNMFTFNSSANIELIDTNAEQAWMYLEPKINQTSTAGWIGLLMDVTETSLGDASAGAGYNALLDLRVAGTTQFGIQNDGKIMTNQAAAYTTLGNVTDRVPIYDGTGVFIGYIAIYDNIT